jgi:hypothetical protein
MIKGIRQRPILCSVAAIVCALAMLVFAFAHNVHHVDALVPAAVSQLDGVSGDDPSGSPNKAVVINHCHGCVTVGIPLLAEWTLPSLQRPQPPIARAASICPHPPAAELPPPIAAV